MEQIYSIGALLVGLAVIQSIFGMGILVFGTPTLLLLGIDFSNVLGWLLPSSLAVSWLQVMTNREEETQESDLLFRLAVVGVPLACSLSLAILLNWKARIDLWIGLALLFAAATRLIKPLNEAIATALNRRKGSYLAFMGAFHGVTNMGGALLSMYASSVGVNKYGKREITARYYLLFGSVQMVVLAMLERSALSRWGFLLSLFSALAYYFVGNVIFVQIRPTRYEGAFTLFIAAYGVALLFKANLTP